MPRKVVQPTAGMMVPLGPYSHATVVTGGTLVFLGGQVAADKNGKLVGKDDLKAQVAQVMENIRLALAAAGATYKDVVQARIFTTRVHEFMALMTWRCQQWPEFWGSKTSGQDSPATTCVGVTQLWDEAMVEIDCIAQIPSAK
jgi:2-iminobutanoate/2-iminopropanoate deaminase